MANHNIAGAAPNLYIVAVEVLDGLNGHVLGLVHVNVGGTGDQLADVEVEASLIGVCHDLRKEFLNVQSGDVLDVAVKATPVVFHAVVILGGFGWNGLHHGDG